jgi:hypothetical protein
MRLTKKLRTMSRRARLLFGLGVAIALGVAVPVAVGQLQDPPPDSPSCYREVISDYFSGMGDSPTPEGAMAVEGKNASTFDKREVKSGEHVVFEKSDDGKIVEAHEVVKLEGNGWWAVTNSKFGEEC